MNRKLITNLDTDENQDLSAVNMITLKKFHPNAPAHTHEVTKDIDLKHNFSVINAKQHSYEFYKTHYDNLLPFEDIRGGFLSREEEMPMNVQLNMNHNSITNLKDPQFGGEAATKNYVDTTTSTIVASTASSIAARLSLSGGKMTGQIDMGKFMIVNLPKPFLPNNAVNLEFVNGKVDNLKNIMNKKAITATSHAKDEFRYLMEDEDESSSEANISVEGIVDFAQSPHLFNKKAYALKIDKRSADNVFYGRIGFNMYKIPEGEYTICVEFFPAKMDGVRVSFSSTALNVNRQATKKFLKYSRSIVNMHKWHISPPEYLMIDMEWQGTADDGETEDAHLIIYGIAGNQIDVPSAVFDAPFSFGNNEMIMQTNLNLNGHTLTAPTQSLVFARYVKGKHSECLIFPNEKEDDRNYWQFWGVDFKILSVALDSGASGASQNHNDIGGEEESNSEISCCINGESSAFHFQSAS